ncbi:MAG: cobalt-precorrin-6A reductase [Reyranella sp.]|nr:cobalt-precorrin-6A reductase [Reyranella sp.]MDP3158740.1 cobalt-precorrin-6A reductase [Reyranella sp.]
MRVLVLGGTTEASALATLLAGDPHFDATLSLAGRTSSPRPQPLAIRVGGFGGVEGLAQWLRNEKADAVIDATHPYAAQMSANAVAACAQAGLPLGSIVRPPWRRLEDDSWRIVPTAEAAAAALGKTPLRVFLSLGRQDLHAFAAAPQHRYVARTIEVPEQAALPPTLKILQARGPFDRDSEARLLAKEEIDIIVSKNSGGTATYAKIEAARELDLPVIMIARPDKPTGHVLGSPTEAVAWLHGCAPGSRRGV